MGNGLAATAGLGMGVMIVAVIVGIVVGALILMLATKLVEKFTPSFGKAVVAVIAGGIASFIVRIALHAVTSVHFVSGLAGVIVGFLVTAWVIMTMIKRPSGDSMSYGRACLIALVEWVIGIIILLVVGLVFGGLVVAAMHR